MDQTGANIFALDIGTRSVVGIVAQAFSNGLEIIAAESIEYHERAMLDGQIHDIEKVASVVKEVKEKLQEQTGLSLNQVAVAAAGRALKTVRTEVEQDINPTEEITRNDILSMELQCVQQAQQILGQELPGEDNTHYHCVGYSVVKYYLDGYPIKNLWGQKGRRMGVDIVATFLPRVVVDSLFAVLHQAGLEMMSLTLEPIAASSVIVPPNMRQLNIALVDVGAGTSDIAITNDGSVVAYAMVPMAGDEITEYLCNEYLLDFQAGEKLKRDLMEKEIVDFEDILGNRYQLPSKEIIEKIENQVNILAENIAEKILSFNQKPPQAVLCIGGGSQTPLLTEKLAANLNLSNNRVAIRGREVILSVTGASKLEGPEAVTPIGIAVNAFQNQGLGFAKVKVNGQEVRLFEVNGGTVGDALLAAGIDMKKLHARLGLALTVTVNDELKIVRGTRGQPAVIKVNGQDATIDTPVKHNDVIYFKEAVDGEDGSGYIRDILPEIVSIRYYINNEPVALYPLVTMDGVIVGPDTPLHDNARITYKYPATIGEALEMSGHETEGYNIYVNGEKVTLDFPFNENINLVMEKKINEAEYGTPSWLVGVMEGMGEMQLDNEENIVTETGIEKENTIGFDFKFIKETQVFVNDEIITIDRSDLIFTDILTKVQFPLTPPKPGSRLVMEVNGRPAEFTTPLQNGDRIKLFWAESLSSKED